jgi:Tol biopolymer transport system component
VDPKTIAVVIRSVASAEERILPRRFEHRVAGLTIGAPIWFADSRSVLVPDLVNNRALFRRMDVETAEEQVVYDGSYPSTYTAAQLSPDGKTLYFGYRTDSEQTLHLMKRNLGSGKEVELYQTKSSGVGLFALTVSPDGARIAFSVNSERGNNHRDLISLSTQGGKPTVLQRGAYRDWVLGIGQWTNNGAHVLIGVRDPGSRSVRLWAVAGNGEKRPLDMSFSFERMSSLSFSPDGRRLAFTGDLMKQELWVIDNLLPEMRAAR